MNRSLSLCLILLMSIVCPACVTSKARRVSAPRVSADAPVRGAPLAFTADPSPQRVLDPSIDAETVVVAGAVAALGIWLLITLSNSLFGTHASAATPREASTR